ncbi:MAG: hypothetical protein ACOY82_00055, partial [Pseudomonadota bacterium]
KTGALNRSAISPLFVVRRAFARFADLTIDLRSMFAPAFGLRSQDRRLEPLSDFSGNRASSRLTPVPQF